MERKVALINGASRGIGLATAKVLQDRGYRVAITARDGDGLREALAELTAGGAIAIAGASADPAHRAEAVARTIEAFGSLDVLINNAGVNPRYSTLVDLEEDALAKVLTANLEAPLGWTREAVKAGLAERGGCVVNVASVAGLRVQVGLGAYAASKAGIVHLTRQLAYELAPAVRVNSVSPGLVETNFAAGLWAGHGEEIAAHYPLGRLGRPEDVAQAIAFLASPEASWITGSNLVIDGGLLANDSVNGQIDGLRVGAVGS